MTFHSLPLPAILVLYCLVAMVVIVALDRAIAFYERRRTVARSGVAAPKRGSERVRR